MRYALGNIIVGIGLIIAAIGLKIGGEQTKRTLKEVLAGITTGI